ncbi:unnamed protein product [Toxocara canis]|uniref:RING-type domain-containing protein n=1 Tax=Toxocara canis TaxID=6265 RepID=A0A183UKC0_TOXCA|nr:unnamed protein product [Toxocara canis]
MAVSSVDAVKTGSRMPHSDSTHAHTNEARRRFPHNNNTRRRDGAGSSRGGGYAHNRRGHVAPKKQMLTLDECQHLFAGVPSRTHHGSVKMQGELTECDICCRESDLFAIGECSHPLCMECGIRLRILSKADTCPKCRAVLETMYFVPYAGDWSTFVMPKDFVEHADCERYKIKFANDYAVKCYDSYLAHVCIICEKKDVKREFPTFAALNQHVWMVHRFEFCEICAEHLNLLSRERRIYSRLDLERHLETGDPDDKSQKGFLNFRRLMCYATSL